MCDSSPNRIKNAALEGYEKEYSKKTVKHRSGRVQARRIMEKKKGKAALKGKDVDHIDGNPNNNAPSNLRLVDSSKNRSNNGHRKGETYAKAKKGITNTFKQSNMLNLALSNSLQQYWALIAKKKG
jgi:hypothetical protein